MAKRAVAPIANEKVRLRLLTSADLPTTLRWRNQEGIRKWFFFSDVITAQQHEEWFGAYLDRDNDFVFVIEDRDDRDRPVGQVALYNVDWLQGMGEFGRLMIGEPDASGKGLAKAATAAILSFAEETLGLRGVYLEVISDNLSARGVYLACGFKLESEADRVVVMCRRFGSGR